jgi:hypothetical protein
MDQERIKKAFEACRLDCHDAVGNAVVGDCPTRGYEMASIVDEAIDRVIQVLKEEGVLNDTERVQKQDGETKDCF